jgi:hypothetical protein
MLPLDGARILEAALARMFNPGHAASVVCRVGLLTSLVLFVAAMTADQTRLMGLAVFGAGVCWIHLRRLDFVEEPGLRVATHSRRSEGRGAEISFGPLPPISTEPILAPDAKTPVTDDAAELDRVLAKISASGLGSLTPGEGRTLAAATERRRKEQARNTNNR